MRKKNRNTRKEVRRNLIFYLSVTNSEDGTTIGEIIDITETGLLLITEQLFPIGQEMNVRVEFPKGPDFPDKTLDLDIIVQWSRKDTANSDLYLIGCKIIEPGEPERRLIKLLINTIGFSNGQRHITFTESVPGFTEPNE